MITGRKMKIFEEHEKALFLRELSKTHCVPLAETVTVGDSRSDREVFKIAGFRIAVNQDGFLKKLADVDLKTKDLRIILKHL
jgi:phosphoserine phosphatase